MILTAITRAAGICLLGTALSVAPCFSAPVSFCYVAGCIVGVSLTPTGDASAAGTQFIQSISLSGTGSGGLAGFNGATGVATINAPTWSPGSTGTFNTEMLQLDLNGGGGMLLRESPTHASNGQTQITEPGPFRISSFFDVFTELSLDGGQTWAPQMDGSASITVPEADLQVDGPEPASWLLLAGGALAIAAGKRRRR